MAWRPFLFLITNPMLPHRSPKRGKLRQVGK